MSQSNNVMIEVREVCKRFKEVQAVDHIDLSITQGEYVALLGPNGAGVPPVMVPTLVLAGLGLITFLGGLRIYNWY